MERSAERLPGGTGGVYREEEIHHRRGYAPLAAGELPGCGRCHLCAPGAIISRLPRQHLGRHRGSDSLPVGLLCCRVREVHVDGYPVTAESGPPCAHPACSRHPGEMPKHRASLPGDPPFFRSGVCVVPAEGGPAWREKFDAGMGGFRMTSGNCARS